MIRNVRELYCAARSTDNARMEAPITPKSATAMTPQAWSAPSHPVDRVERAHLSAIARSFGPITLILLLAAFIRFYQLGFESLSHDEAWRANWTNVCISPQPFRFPPLQYAVGWAAQHLVGRGEAVLRFPYAVAGLACVWVVYRLTRQVGCTGAALLAAALATVHPVLLFYSREFSVFGWEALACGAVSLSALHCCRSTDSRAIRTFAATACVCTLATFTTALVVLAWTGPLAYRWLFVERDDRIARRRFLVWAGCYAVVAVAWAIWVSRFPFDTMVEPYFGTVEKTWPTDRSPATLGTWALWSSFGASQFIAGSSRLWPPLNWIVWTTMSLAVLAGLPVLWRRARVVLLVAGLIIAQAIVIGALRVWPWGNLRTTTFLVPLFVVAAAVGLTEIIRGFRLAPMTIVVVMLALLLPTWRAAKAVVIAPQPVEHLRPIVEQMEARRCPGDAVFVYYAIRQAFLYYSQDASAPVLLQSGDDRDHDGAFIDRFDAFLSEHERVWLLLGHDWRGEHDRWLKLLGERYELLDEIANHDCSAHLFALRAADVQHPPQPAQAASVRDE